MSQLSSGRPQGSPASAPQGEESSEPDCLGVVLWENDGRGGTAASVCPGTGTHTQTCPPIYSHTHKNRPCHALTPTDAHTGSYSKPRRAEKERSRSRPPQKQARQEQPSTQARTT